MVLLIDNYDSFTFNLKDFFFQCGVHVEVKRSENFLFLLEERKWDGVVISPGPGHPSQYPHLYRLLDYVFSLPEQIPVLGICLGHQVLANYFGATISYGLKPMHGKLSSISTCHDFIFNDLPKSFDVVRYHSLVVTNKPTDLEVIASSKENEIMAIRHKEKPIRGIQFHPEAHLTQHGLKIIKNWLQHYSIVV